ncbi:MAG: hypothetical protein WC421_07655 [Elusimicrobiales bacterium]
MTIKILCAQAQCIQPCPVFAKVAKIAKTKKRSFGERQLVRTRVIYIVRQIAKKFPKVSVYKTSGLYRKSFGKSWRFWRKPEIYQYKCVRQNSKTARQIAKTGGVWR